MIRGFYYLIVISHYAIYGFIIIILNCYFLLSIILPILVSDRWGCKANSSIKDCLPKRIDKQIKITNLYGQSIN